MVFAAADSSPPQSKSGTLVFETSDVQSPRGQVALSGYISTVCVEASRWVYTVDVNGTLSRFDPSTLAFADIGTLQSPGDSIGPNSMAVDQDAVAWVNYNDGNLFKVDTSTGKCEATGFVPDQHGLKALGMGFVFDPTTGHDTLYVAGNGNNSPSTQSTLATIAFPSLTLAPIGPLTAGIPEIHRHRRRPAMGLCARCGEQQR